MSDKSRIFVCIPFNFCLVAIRILLLFPFRENAEQPLSYTAAQNKFVELRIIIAETVNLSVVEILTGDDLIVILIVAHTGIKCNNQTISPAAVLRLFLSFNFLVGNI